MVWQSLRIRPTAGDQRVQRKKWKPRKYPGGSRRLTFLLQCPDAATRTHRAAPSVIYAGFLHASCAFPCLRNAISPVYRDNSASRVWKLELTRLINQSSHDCPSHRPLRPYVCRIGRLKHLSCVGNSEQEKPKTWTLSFIHCRSFNRPLFSRAIINSQMSQEGWSAKLGFNSRYFFWWK
jgi:hypothetical protein